MSALADRIRKARQFKRDIDGWRLILRRPTEEEGARIFTRDTVEFVELAKEYVIGWEGVKESDIVVSGTTDDVPFDPDVWREVIVDRPELWRPIAEQITESWLNNRKAREERSKN